MDFGYYLLFIFLLLIVTIVVIGAVYYMQIYRRRRSFVDIEFAPYPIVSVTERRLQPDVDEWISPVSVRAVADVDNEPDKILDKHDDIIDYDRSNQLVQPPPTHIDDGDEKIMAPPTDPMIIDHHQQKLTTTVIDNNDAAPDGLNDHTPKRVSFEPEVDDDKSIEQQQQCSIPRIKSIKNQNESDEQSKIPPMKKLNRFFAIDRAKLTITPDDNRRSSKNNNSKQLKIVQLSATDLQTDESIDDDSSNNKNTKKPETTSSKFWSGRLEKSKSDKEIVQPTNNSLKHLSFNDDDFKTNDDLLEFLHFHLSSSDVNNDAATTLKSSQSANSLAHIRHLSTSNSFTTWNGSLNLIIDDKSINNTCSDDDDNDSVSTVTSIKRATVERSTSDLSWYKIADKRNSKTLPNLIVVRSPIPNIKFAKKYLSRKMPNELKSTQSIEIVIGRLASENTKDQKDTFFDIFDWLKLKYPTEGGYNVRTSWRTGRHIVIEKR